MGHGVVYLCDRPYLRETAFHRGLCIEFSLHNLKLSSILNFFIKTYANLTN